MGLFGSSGTRGLIHEDLTPAFVEGLAAATAGVWETDQVAIGRDTRSSGPMLSHAAAAGFMSAGVDVERVGVIPTPGLQDYLARTGKPGCMITASHNPPAYNGVKLFDANGLELGGETLDGIEAAVDRSRRHRVPWDEIGTERKVSGVPEAYVQGIVDAVDAESIAAQELTVAVDPGHGAGCDTTPHLCRELGCRVVTVNASMDGSFPGRPPEPVPEALEDLQRLVQASDADLGVAHDGDADRAVFVDSTGTVVDGDTTLALLAEAVVDPGDTVVTAVNASQRVIDAVTRAGGQVEQTPIGSANLVQRISACQAAGDRVPLAGEGNGGIFFPEHRLTRDGAYVLARMLELLEDRSLKDRAAAHQGYHLEKRKLRYDSPGERSRMLASIEEAAARTDASVDRTDGIRLNFEDGWVLARPSGTEPLIRISAEARDPKTVQAYIEQMTNAVEAH